MFWNRRTIHPYTLHEQMEERRRSRKKEWDVRWGRKKSEECGRCLEGCWGRNTERIQWPDDRATADLQSLQRLGSHP